MNKCRVIAVENQKGGTGKSTTVMNLGVGLVREGKRVLLIDADPQGGLSISLGIKRSDDLDVSLAAVLTLQTLYGYRFRHAYINHAYIHNNVCLTVIDPRTI